MMGETNQAGLDWFNELLANDPEFRKAFENRERDGLTEEEQRNPFQALMSAGIQKLWQTKWALHVGKIDEMKKRLPSGLAEEQLFADEERKHGYREAAELAQIREEGRQRLEDQTNNPTPLWGQISDLHRPGEDFIRSPADRREKICRLLLVAKRTLRYEILADDKRKLDRQNRTTPVNRDEIYETYLWDPLRILCNQLQLVPRRLSEYSKEVTGMSASEMVDSIRAETVRTKLKAKLKEFASEYFAKGTVAPIDKKKCENRSEVDIMYDVLRKSRRQPVFHRTTWAMEYGFSSYQKFFRACLLCYGKTPHQLEYEILGEIIIDRKDYRPNLHRENEVYTTDDTVQVPANGANVEELVLNE